MVVLDGHSHNMLGAGPNHYLQPDYLSTLPTTLDAKKSPLALLAQTCSQIGADTPNSKSLLPSMDASKRKSSTSSESNSLNSSDTNSLKNGQERDRERERDRSESNSNSRPRSSGNTTSSAVSAKPPPISSVTGKSSPAFKPYESSQGVTKSKEESNNSKAEVQEKPKSPSKRPASSSPHDMNTSSSGSGVKSARKSPPTPTSRERNSSPVLSENGKSSPNKTSNNFNERGASPIIRSGLEVLHGQGLGMKINGGSALSSLSALAAHYPPGFDLSNPALRPPFFAPPSAHHFFGGGYPPSALSATGAGGSPYVSYTRVKTPSGAETIVPVCKDPYCTGCSLSMQGLMANAAAAAAAGLMSGSGVCPAGCAQCDHQKYSIPLPPFMTSPGFGYPPNSAAVGYPASLLSQHAQAQAAQVAQAQAQAQAQAAHLNSAQRQHHVCSWIVGDSYCGKRLSSPEELLQHLQTHTRLPTSEAAAAANLAAMGGQNALYSSALLSSSMNAMNAAAAAMHRTYPTPPLSPLSAAAARYHPYGASGSPSAAGKPGLGGPGSLSSLVPHPQSLANYYSSMSPYALYGQRIGPPVHP